MSDERKHHYKKCSPSEYGEKELADYFAGNVKYYSKQFDTVRWEDSNGLLHRDFGPAIDQCGFYSRRVYKWYKHGQLHREDGPAIIYPSGAGKYYLNGKEYKDEKEWKKALEKI